MIFCIALYRGIPPALNCHNLLNNYARKNYKEYAINFSVCSYNPNIGPFQDKILRPSFPHPTAFSLAGGYEDIIHNGNFIYTLFKIRKNY